MIASFKNPETEALARTGKSRKFQSVEKVAKRKLDQIEFASALEDLKVPPGNQLEKLEADRDGQHSIRINDQFRICFRWAKDGVHDVEVVDYH